MNQPLNWHGMGIGLSVLAGVIFFGLKMAQILRHISATSQAELTGV